MNINIRLYNNYGVAIILSEYILMATLAMVLSTTVVSRSFYSGLDVRVLVSSLTI